MRWTYKLQDTEQALDEDPAGLIYEVLFFECEIVKSLKKAFERGRSMIEVTDEVLADMVLAIVREVAPEHVYLYGSHACGDARKDSDVDLFIVVREPFGPGHSRFYEINRIRRVLSSFRISKDILVYSSEEFAKWSRCLNHVGGRCYREGKLLYARS